MTKLCRLVVSASILTTVAVYAPSALAAPVLPEYSDDASRVLWFLVVSDDHITARNSSGADRLEWLLSTGIDVVEPEIIFNTGDLTDASNGEPLVSFYPGPQEDEWQLYRSIVDASGVSVDNYIDLAGNHDQYDDEGLPHYLQYSLAGSTWERTQHSIVIEKPWGKYHFLGINTPGNDGANWPLDNAGLDVSELLFGLRALEDNADARQTYVFGHHPIVRPDMGFKLGEGSDEIQKMFGDFYVRAYFYGHTHEYRDLFWMENDLMPVTLNENVASLGLSDENYVLLATVDHDNLHVKPFKAGDFPWVMVTTPADVNQGGGNPWAYTVPTGMEKAPIRAVAFSTDEFLSCQYSLDGGPWVQMTAAGKHVFQGFMDTRGMTVGNHQVEVRALPGPATGNKITFSVTAYACGDGIDQDDDGLTDYPTDPGCDSVTDTDEYNDPVVPEPDVIESVEQIPEEATDIIEETDVGDNDMDAVADVFDDAGADDGTGKEIVVPYDPGTPPDQGNSADNGSADVRIDNSGQVEDTGVVTDESSGDETINPQKPSDGGCSSTSDGNVSGAMFLLLAFLGIVVLRRKVTI